VITDYASLQASIGQWLARADLAPAAPGLIQLAEIRLGRDLQRMEHRRLMATATGALSAGAVALPSDYAAIRSLSVPWGAGNLVLKPLDSTQQETVASYPAGYWIDGLTLRVVAGGSSPYTLDYFRRLPSITLGPNFAVEEAPDAYLYASLLEAAPYLKADSRIATWQAGYDAAIGALEEANRRARAGSGKRIRPDFRVP